MAYKTIQLVIFTLVHSVVIITATPCQMPDAVRPCLRPPLDRLVKQLAANRNNDPLQESFANVPPFGAEIQNFLNSQEMDVSKNVTIPFELSDSTCPSGYDRTPQQMVDLRERSHCPWYLQVNSDDMRIPRILINAKCKCDHCLGLGNSNECELVTRRVPVLRQRHECDQDGYYKYTESWETIGVGCTCAFPNRSIGGTGSESETTSSGDGPQMATL